MVSFMYDGTMETIKQMIRSKLRFPEQLLRIADKYDVSVLKETIELALIPLDRGQQCDLSLACFRHVQLPPTQESCRHLPGPKLEGE